MTIKLLFYYRISGTIAPFQWLGTVQKYSLTIQLTNTINLWTKYSINNKYYNNNNNTN